METTTTTTKESFFRFLIDQRHCALLKIVEFITCDCLLIVCFMITTENGLLAS